MLSKEEISDIRRIIDTARMSLSAPYTAELRADIKTEFFEGYSLDMLQDVLSVAEYTSLFFFLRPEHQGSFDGKTFVYAPAFQEWAHATL